MFSKFGTHPKRGLVIITVSILIAVLAGFARIEQSSCQRSNEVRTPLNATAATFRKISAEYRHEVLDPQAPISLRADAITRAAHLLADAEALEIKYLRCTFPFPER